MDLFEMANTLAVESKKTVKKSGKTAHHGVVVRRGGQVIKDTVVRKVVPYPEIKVKNREDKRGWSVPAAMSPCVRREWLGKLVYEAREELLDTLVRGYGEDINGIKTLSLNALTERLAEVHLRASKLWLSHKILPAGGKQYVGYSPKSFKIVSAVAGKAVDYEALHDRNMKLKDSNREGLENE